MPFGYKTGWVAIRSDDGAKIVEALGLKHANRVGWGAGVGAAYENGIFVTPSVDGWTLVMGSQISDGSPSAALIRDRLGCEVQVYSSHRVAECHLWERAELDGDLRFFSIEDGETESRGSLSPVELDLGLATFLEAWNSDDADDADEMPDEDMVMAIAANWSIDPNTLSGSDDRLGWFTSQGIDKALLRQ